MYYDVMWESPSKGKRKKTAGVVRIAADKTIDALSIFFKQNKGHDKRLVEIHSYDEPTKEAKT